MQSQIPSGYIPIQVAGYPQIMAYPPQQPNFIPNYQPQIPMMEAPMEMRMEESLAPLPVLPTEVLPKVNQLKEDPSKLPSIIAPEAPRERWKRDDDKKMFSFLRDYCMKSGDSIDNIYERLNSAEDKDNGFWIFVSNSIKWKGPIYMLQKRFVKL